MPGRTIYLEDNPNDFSWGISSDHGHDFEKLIGLCLKRHVTTQDGRVSVHPTRASGDAGRDFEIYFSGTLALFGLTIQVRKGETKGVVFIECKSTEHDRLDDGFLADASQHGDSEACAYVLVTNAVITPYVQYRAQHEWGRLGMSFYLIDRRKLADLLHTYGMVAEAQRLDIVVPAATMLPPFARDRLVVACQTEYRPRTNARSVQVFVSMSNYSAKSVLSNLQLATDLQWCTRESHYERVIEPGMIESVQLIADREDLSTPGEISLNLSVNGRSQRLTAMQRGTEVLLDPPFLGSGHLHLRNELRRLAEIATALTIVSIQGEAGVGKSRTVNEAIEPLTHGRYDRFFYNCSPQGLPEFTDCYETMGLTPISDSVSDALRVSELLRAVANSGLPIILQFEDLHHAEESVITTFKEVVLHPLPSRGPFVLILTGRDDHTFPNEDYYSFLQLVADSTKKHIFTYTLLPFTDGDSRNLIRSVVKDMPEVGVDCIHRLGQNNPFIIVEVLQFLLDAHLARLLSRRTIGILNPEVFSGRKGLPETVEELYQQRLAALLSARGGQLASDFLVIASFFGFRIPESIRRSFFDGEPDEGHAWGLLVERRFVREDIVAGETSFAHENLLHYIRRRVRQKEYAVDCSALLLERPGLCKRLSQLDLGEAYYLHQDYVAAFNCFVTIRDHIHTITNFSSEEIPRVYFAYIPAFFQTARVVNAPIGFLAKVALAYGYMGVHNFPLVIAEDACMTALTFLRELYPEEKDGLHEKLAIAQLRAHALQNMGKTGVALQQMLEIDATFREAGAAWPDVAFDLYDRLQEYYRKTNHKKLADFYDRRASECVEKAKDEKLRAAHLITHALVCLYGGYQEVRERAAQAHEAAVRVGIRRFITYTRVTQLIVDVLYKGEDSELLNATSAEARALLQDAVMESFSDSIMRIELLLGTLALHAKTDQEERRVRARSYVKSGQANSIRYGNGLFDWAFDNLAAVIDLDDPLRVDEDVRRRFRTCMERLRQRGLTFLGAETGTYPNTFAISNIVRFFGGFAESEGVELVQSVLTAYDNRFVSDHHIAAQLVRRAVKGLPIFWPQKSRLAMLRYPVKDGYFTPIF